MQLHQRFAASMAASQPEATLALAAAAETVGASVRTDLLLTDSVLLQAQAPWRITLMAVLGSVLAGGALYVLGALLGGLGALPLLANLGLGPLIGNIQAGMHSYAPLLVLAAGVATAPFAALMLLTGLLGAAPLWLLPVAVLARGVRYGLLAWLLWRGGTRFRDWLARYYHGLTLVVALGLLLLAVSLLLLKYL